MLLLERPSAWKFAGGPDFGLAIQRRETIIAVGALLALVATQISGTLAASVFMIATLGLMASRPIQSIKDIVTFAPLLVLPILAILSTTWSDAPQRTARAAMQLFITFSAAIIISRRLKMSTFVLTLFYGMLTICLLALPQVPYSVASGKALIGPFETKNPMGFAAELLFTFSLVVAFDREHNRLIRGAAALTTSLAIPLILLSHSGGALAAAAITAILLPSFMIFGRIQMSARIVVLSVVVTLLLVAAVLVPDIQAGISDFRQNVLGKDATLTGRTQLWTFAARIVAERPLLGMGYYSFWRQGNIDAEGLWRWAGIGARSGFNFHNAFVEMRVDLGLVGEIALVITCVGVALAGLIREIFRPSIPMAGLLALLFVLYVRSYAETGLIGPFSLMTILFVATGVYALAPGSKAKVR